MGGAAEAAAGGRRNTIVLALCQALYTSAISVDLTLTGIVGFMLASDKGLATLPFSIITVAAAATTILASWLMARIGRRRGLALGAAVGAAGGLVSVWAIFHGSFAAFCVGTASVGVFQAFAGYYRLAAADGVGLAAKGRAIATVLTGGVIAAVLGPAIAGWSKDLLAPTLFAGSYLVVTLFGGVSVLLLLTLYREVHGDAPGAAAAPVRAEKRPLRVILRQPVFLAALANNVIGYAVMMFVMTATPLAVVACSHSIDDGAGIIQWHLVGMFAPSFFSGHLLKRFGAGALAVTGALLAAASALVSLHGTGLVHFYAALLALGIGWNFMYVAGTTLLARSYRPEERAATQATSEFATYAATATASLLAGQFLARWGWASVNLAVLPLLAVAVIVTLLWAAAERRARPAAVEARV